MTIVSKANGFYLPDLFSVSTAFSDSINPHYKEAAAESQAWVNKYNLLPDRKRAFFAQGRSELLVAHAYPRAPFEQLRAVCDLVNLLFVVSSLKLVLFSCRPISIKIDEISDDQDGSDARKTGQVYLNAMRDPNWDDGSSLAKMTKEYELLLRKKYRFGC
jgi:hypothetical protein